MLQLPHRLFVVAILAALLVTQRATLILAQTTPTPLTSPTPAPQTTPSADELLKGRGGGSAP